MVTSIARQSVIIKCQQETSVLIGNYEFYYLAGLLKKLYNLDLSKDMDPDTLLANIRNSLDSITPADSKEAYLITLVSVYKPLPDYNSQMQELFTWGETEEHLWEVHI